MRFDLSSASTLGRRWLAQNVNCHIITTSNQVSGTSQWLHDAKAWPVTDRYSVAALWISSRGAPNCHIPRISPVLRYPLTPCWTGLAHHFYLTLSLPKAKYQQRCLTFTWPSLISPRCPGPLHRHEAGQGIQGTALSHQVSMETAMCVRRTAHSTARTMLLMGGALRDQNPMGNLIQEWKTTSSPSRLASWINS
jgi:hypothetical protein